MEWAAADIFKTSVFPLVLTPVTAGIDLSVGSVLAFVWRHYGLLKNGIALPSNLYIGFTIMGAV